MSLFLKLDKNLQPLPADAQKKSVAAIQVVATGLIFAALNVGKREMNHADAVAACAALDHCGKTDWRLPERMELEQALDLTKYDPAVDADYFFWIKPTWYWSATAYAPYASSLAWLVLFSGGSSSYSGRSYEYDVLAVRSAGQ